MKKSVLLLVLVILALLVLSSCSRFNFPGTGAPATASVRSGGLGLSFMQNLPPLRIFDTDQMTVQVQLFNTGQTDLGFPGDRVYLSGFDHNIVTGVPLGGLPIPPIDAATEFTPQGSFDFVTFDNIQLALIPSARMQAPILATACYGYGTQAAASVCVDPTPHEASLKPKVCNSQVVQMQPHLAPVTVSTIQVEPRKGVTTFRIGLQNAGGGTVFKQGTEFLQRCSPYSQDGLSFNEVDYVRVAEVLLGNDPVTAHCKNRGEDGHVRLSNGQGVFVCDVPVRGNSAYTTQLSVLLDYGYRSEIATTVEIVRTP